MAGFWKAFGKGLIHVAKAAWENPERVEQFINMKTRKRPKKAPKPGPPTT